MDKCITSIPWPIIILLGVYTRLKKIYTDATQKYYVRGNIKYVSNVKNKNMGKYLRERKNNIKRSSHRDPKMGENRKDASTICPLDSVCNPLAEEACDTAIDRISSHPLPYRVGE